MQGSSWGVLAYLIIEQWEVLTLPRNFSAPAKKPTREHAMFLWILYESGPQVIVKSECAPEMRRLEAVEALLLRMELEYLPFQAVE